MPSRADPHQRSRDAAPGSPPARWRVLIADDEPAARRGVRQLLAAHPAFGVAGECRNGAEVLAALDTARPHMVFLDIQMPGIDGFEVVRRRTPDRMPLTIFLTAYEEHALKAFDAQALDYLVKPVSAARFAATMRRVERALAAASGGTAREPVIAVGTSRGTILLRLRDIDWVEAADNYSRIWVGGRSWLRRESLTSLEPRVRPHGFVRAHRQALVRLGAVRELTRSAGNAAFAVLGSGARVPVSRRRRAAFMRGLRGVGP